MEDAVALALKARDLASSGNYSASIAKYEESFTRLGRIPRNETIETVLGKLNEEYEIVKKLDSSLQSFRLFAQKQLPTQPRLSASSSSSLMAGASVSTPDNRSSTKPKNAPGLNRQPTAQPAGTRPSKNAGAPSNEGGPPGGDPLQGYSQIPGDANATNMTDDSDPPPEENLYKGFDPKLVSQVEQEFLTKSPNVKWEDVVGLQEAKQLLREAVILPDIMPNFFKGAIKPYKGILMFGPPGTGKTMLAKAVATECGKPFFCVSPSTFATKFRGESEQLVRILFIMARQHSPSVIFIDEIDAICSTRTANESEGSLRMKSELLIQLNEAVNDPATRTILIGATNNPQTIDDAMRRRLEKRIEIPLPSKEDRVALFKSVLNESAAPDVDFEQLAERTNNYSCADITSIVRDTMIHKMRQTTSGMSEMEMRQLNEELKNNSSGATVNMEDLTFILSRVSSSVSAESIENTIKFNAEFGSR